MVVYFIVGCVVLGVLGAGIPIYFIFRNTRRDFERSSAAVMRRAGKAKIEIEAGGACIDPTSPNRKFGSVLLTDSKIIYAGHSGGEIVISRDAISKVEIATPIMGSDEAGDILLISHELESGESEIFRISVDRGKQWLFLLAPGSEDEASEGAA